MNPKALCLEFVSMVWHDTTSAFSPREWRAVLKKLSQMSSKKIVRNFLFVIPQFILFYGLLSPAVAMSLYNHMLFFPDKILRYDVDQIAGIPKEDAWIRRQNGKKLHGWYFGVKDPKGVVLISHGNAGNISYRIPLIDVFLQRKFSVLAYDYSGYGNSEGEPSIETTCEDGVAAYDYLLKEKKFQPLDVVVYGESLGGGITTYVASKRQCKAIILQSTFASLPSVAKRKMLLMRLYPRFLFPANSLNSASILEGKHPPLLIVHGEMDRIIPIAESEIIYNRASEPKQFERLKDTDHNDVYGDNCEAFANVIGRFLDSISAPAAKTSSILSGGAID